MTRTRRGLSLVEILVAVAIVAAVFIPVFRLFMAGVEATKYTEDRLRAFAIAKRQIEAIKHANTINRTSHDLLVRAYGTAPGFSPYTVDGRYRVLTHVDPAFEVSENGVTAEVTFVRVRVEWELQGVERNLELETFVDRAYN
jgi:prepilin-type N-terminal cleavage/methylation domain-containing protein